MQQLFIEESRSNIHGQNYIWKCFGSVGHSFMLGDLVISSQFGDEASARANE